MSEITCEFTPTHPLHLLTTTIHHSQRLAGVRIEPLPDEQVLAYATNGMGLAMTKESGTCAEPVIAPATCFQRRKNETLTVFLNGMWTKHARSSKFGIATSLYPKIDNEFPTVRRVLPSSVPDNAMAVSLNPQLLLDIANAIGRTASEPMVTLFFTPLADGAAGIDTEAPMIVCIPDGGIGLQMQASSDSHDGTHDRQRKYYNDFVTSITPATTE